MPELILAQAVEVRHNRVEFVDHVCFFVVFEFAALDAHSLRPLAIGIVPRRQPPGECRNSLPKRIVLARAWDWKRGKYVEVHVNLHKTPRVPIKWERA